MMNIHARVAIAAKAPCNETAPLTATDARRSLDVGPGWTTVAGQAVQS